MRKLLLPTPIPTFTPIPTAITGDGITLGLDAGGSLGNGHAENSFWTPVSIRKRDDGSTAVFPHFVLDRGKPGLIAVNKNGNRFVSEATDYHSFGKAMYTNKGKGTIPCYFICDNDFIQKSFAHARPGMVARPFASSRKILTTAVNNVLTKFSKML